MSRKSRSYEGVVKRELRKAESYHQLWQLEKK